MDTSMIGAGNIGSTLARRWPRRPTRAEMQAKRLMLMILPLAFTRALPAQQASSHTMVYAVYQGETTASDVLRSMRKAQHAAGERIESYALVSRDLNGRVAVQERPAEPSPAITALLGTLDQPSEAAAQANAIDDDVVDSLQASLIPGTSAVIAVLDDRWVKDVQRELREDRARTMMFTRISGAAFGAGAEQRFRDDDPDQGTR